MKNATAVILAGTLRPSPLRQALDVPVLCLPVGADQPLITAWRAALSREGVEDVRVVVNDEREVEAVAQAAGRARRSMRIIAEPASWRGTAGLLQDATADLADDAVVLAIEAACLPPVTLAPLERALGDDAGVLGVNEKREPFGVSLFRRETLVRHGSAVGYQDLKEQLLPALHAAGLAVRVATVAERTVRLRDRRGYLDAVHVMLARRGGDDHVDAEAQASISGSAIIDGFCIIQAGAVIEDGAVVHESVVLSGATVSGGAVVTRSVIGPRTTVPARARVVREVRAERTPSPMADPRQAASSVR